MQLKHLCLPCLNRKPNGQREHLGLISLADMVVSNLLSISTINHSICLRASGNSFEISEQIVEWIKLWSLTATLTHFPKSILIHFLSQYNETIGINKICGVSKLIIIPFQFYLSKRLLPSARLTQILLNFVGVFSLMFIQCKAHEPLK